MPRTEAGYEGRFDAAGWFLMSAVFRQRKNLVGKPPRLIDLGMGRGRDMIYFARRGFQVEGVDLSEARIERARRRARRLGVRIRTEVADLRTYRFPRKYDVVFSTASLNFLPPKERVRRFAALRTATARGGIHAVNAFLPEGKSRPAPDRDPAERPFRPGELAGYYRGWILLDTGRFEFACDAGGPRHHHALDYVVARRP